MTDTENQSTKPETAGSPAVTGSAKIAEMCAYLKVCMETEWKYVRDAKSWTREAYESKGKAIAYRNTLDVLNAIFKDEPDWRSIADGLADALEKLDALYRDEQDQEAPMKRPEWLRHPWQRYHRALADSANDQALPRGGAQIDFMNTKTETAPPVGSSALLGLARMSKHWPATYRNRIPVKARMAQDLGPDMWAILGRGTPRIWVEKDAELPVVCNQHGAISVVTPYGNLGVRPLECDIIEWREPHESERPNDVSTTNSP